MPAADLVKIITTAREAVEASMQAHGFTVANSKQLHDVALGCTCFGYLPPIRLVCIRTLVHPWYMGKCMYEDCKRGSSCHGNKLVIISTNPPKMHMHLPHHKNEGAWASDVIYLELPHELATLLYSYHSMWPMLTCNCVWSTISFPLQGPPLCSWTHMAPGSTLTLPHSGTIGGSGSRAKVVLLGCHPACAGEV